MLLQEIESLQKQYAPDKRTDRVEVLWRNDSLQGYTTRPEVMDSIASLLENGKPLVNAVRLLPDAIVGDKSVGIINVAVANLRSNPGHSQELATQALLGTPVQILDKQKGWCLVRTPDRYIAWLEPGALVAATPQEARDWMEADNRIYIGQPGEIMTAPGAGTIISTIVSGGILNLDTEQQHPVFSMVRLPDGTRGWLPKEDLQEPTEWWNAETVASAELLPTAAQLSGRPYLWGGTSPNGMDCSGFTKMSYYLNGYVIPRDASQQVKAGEEVSVADGFSNLRPGDQLFFGGYRADGSEKITHTGFYLGNGRFLHAGADNGRIMENSLIEGDKGYAEHRLKSLMRARRLSAGSPGVVPVSEAFEALLQ